MTWNGCFTLDKDHAHLETAKFRSMRWIRIMTQRSGWTLEGSEHSWGKVLEVLSAFCEAHP